jgi:hypothetical protein
VDAHDFIGDGRGAAVGGRTEMRQARVEADVAPVVGDLWAKVSTRPKTVTCCNPLDCIEFINTINYLSVY